MKTSKDDVTQLALILIGEEKISNIIKYCNDIINQPKKIFISKKQISQYFKSHKQSSVLRAYTGYKYKEINSVLRGNWTYEKCGQLTEDKLYNNKALANEISKEIETSDPLKDNIITFRGININRFNSFGIKSIEDLIQLKDNFVFEQGFISTSLIKDNSFFNKKLDYHEDCNVLIKYIVPKSFNDGLPLQDEQSTYSPNQTEFLIDKGSLCYTTDVEISTDNNTATLTQIIVPKRIYEQSEEANNNETVFEHN